jgi:hypothetical protein
MIENYKYAMDIYKQIERKGNALEEFKTGKLQYF